jgi:hypothetical protein
MLFAKDIATDWVKVGTMLGVSHMLGGGSVLDGDWQANSLYTLLGFSSYHLSTRNFIDTDIFGKYKSMANTLIKVATMLIVSRLLSRQNPFDKTWLMTSLLTLIGFAAYELITKHYVKGSEMADHKGLAGAVDDWANFGTMFVVSRLLSCESFLDAKWASSSIATLVGFTAFNMVTRNVLDKLSL